MRRLAASALALALAAAGLAPPAMAADEALLDCASVSVTPAFRDKLADAMLGEGSAQEDALIAQLNEVSESCASRHGLGEDGAANYFAYAIARLPHDALIVRLGALGISAQVIDQALDFGPGRSNPAITGDLTRPQLETLLSALAASGVATEKVADATWHMVGAYAAATSMMWQASPKLR